MPTLIAYWNCTWSAGWSQKTLADKITALYAATFTAKVEVDMELGIPGGPNQVDWIFVAPEYAFGEADRGRALAAEHTDPAGERDLLRAMAAITAEYRTLLLAPGTLTVEEHLRARNTSYGYHSAQQQWRVDKAVGVGETVPPVTFQPGLGYATAQLDNHSYGVEICRDATGTGTLPNQVDRHIIIGQGVGHDAIANKAREYQIVADFGNFGVFDYTNHGYGARILPYKKECSLGSEIHYFRVG